jgi:hypothetical protein
MPLPSPLPLPNPLNIPATPELNFVHAWLLNLKASAPSATTGQLTLEVLPYDAESKTIGGGEHVETLTGPLWEAVAEVPEIQAAFAANLAAVEPFRAWLKAREEKELAGKEPTP